MFTQSWSRIWPLDFKEVWEKPVLCFCADFFFLQNTCICISCMLSLHSNWVPFFTSMLPDHLVYAIFMLISGELFPVLAKWEDVSPTVSNLRLKSVVQESVVEQERTKSEKGIWLDPALHWSTSTPKMLFQMLRLLQIMFSQIHASLSQSRGRRLLQTSLEGQRWWQFPYKWCLLWENLVGAIAAGTSKGFPWPGCWLLQVCPSLSFEIPEAHFPVPYFNFSQAQKVQSPVFSWMFLFFEQNCTQFAQCWCKHRPQIISARGQLII